MKYHRILPLPLLPNLDSYTQGSLLSIQRLSHSACSQIYNHRGDELLYRAWRMARDREKNPLNSWILRSVFSTTSPFCVNSSYGYTWFLLYATHRGECYAWMIFLLNIHSICVSYLFFYSSLFHRGIKSFIKVRPLLIRESRFRFL